MFGSIKYSYSQVPFTHTNTHQLHVEKACRKIVQINLFQFVFEEQFENKNDGGISSFLFSLYSTHIFLINII